MNDMIERMKQNKTPWGWLTVEDVGYISKAKSSDIERLCCTAETEIWYPLDYYTRLMNFADVVRIRPDFQPEPEVVRREVKIYDTELCYFDNKASMWRVIARALDFLDFIGYEYEDIDSDSGEMECYLSQFPREVCDKNVECPAVYPKYVLFAK